MPSFFYLDPSNIFENKSIRRSGPCARPSLLARRLYLEPGRELWIVIVRFFGNKSVKANPWYGLLHLLGSLVMIWILCACIGRIIFKRPSVWRGEYYK